MSKQPSKEVVDRWGPYESVQNFNKSITYGREENIQYRRIPQDAKKFDNLKLNSFDNKKAAPYTANKVYKGTLKTEN